MNPDAGLVFQRITAVGPLGEGCATTLLQATDTCADATPFQAVFRQLDLRPGLCHSRPSLQPSAAPSLPSQAPTPAPAGLSEPPTRAPAPRPTGSPTGLPALEPSPAPVPTPARAPSLAPSLAPSRAPPPAPAAEDRAAGSDAATAKGPSPEELLAMMSAGGQSATKKPKEEDAPKVAGKSKGAPQESAVEGGGVGGNAPGAGPSPEEVMAMLAALRSGEGPAPASTPK